MIRDDDDFIEPDPDEPEFDPDYDLEEEEPCERCGGAGEIYFDNGRHGEVSTPCPECC